MAKDRVKSAMGGEKKSKKSEAKKKSGRKPHSIHVRHAASGGYIAEHKYKAEPGEAAMPEPEEHAIPDMDALHSHMDEHMQPEEQAEPQAAPPAAAAAPPNVGM